MIYAKNTQGYLIIIILIILRGFNTVHVKLDRKNEFELREIKIVVVRVKVVIIS
jgi:hypothetical protein